MNILEWLFGQASTIIDTDWIQTDLRDMPLSDSEYWQIRAHDAEASGAKEPSVKRYEPLNKNLRTR